MLAHKEQFYYCSLVAFFFVISVIIQSLAHVEVWLIFQLKNCCFRVDFGHLGL